MFIAKKKYNKFIKSPTSSAAANKITSILPIKYNPSAKYLLIVESPSKCAKIEQYLGKEYQCIATKGHIRELNGLKSIDSNFEITFEIIKDKAEHVKWMQSIISQFSMNNIILASDDDREANPLSYRAAQVCILASLIK